MGRAPPVVVVPGPKHRPRACNPAAGNAPSPAVERDVPSNPDRRGNHLPGLRNRDFRPNFQGAGGHQAQHAGSARRTPSKSPFTVWVVPVRAGRWPPAKVGRRPEARFLLTVPGGQGCPSPNRDATNWSEGCAPRRAVCGGRSCRDCARAEGASRPRAAWRCWGSPESGGECGSSRASAVLKGLVRFFLGLLFPLMET